MQHLLAFETAGPCTERWSWVSCNKYPKFVAFTAGRRVAVLQAGFPTVVGSSVM